MAEDLTKEILPIEEEQKQEKKLLYKNWKIYATALGIITVGLAVGLGVGLGVQNSSHNTTSTTQKIVNEINNTTTPYTLAANTTNTAASITNQINDDFIKAKLTGDNATAFKTGSFKLNSITVGDDNHSLADSDLTTATTLNAKINYDYDSIKNQTTILTITVSISEQQIVNAINNATYEITTIIAGDTAKSVTDKITDTFIKTSLKNDIKTSFDSNSFKFDTVTVNGTALADSDLTTATTLNAKINYNYGSITNQETNLVMTINANDSQIVDAITNATYKLTTVTVGDTATDVIAKINDTFIKSSLQDEIQSSFNSDSFKLNTVTVNGTALADSDLTTATTLNAKINYNYGSIENKNINLTITINASDQQIVNAINSTSYTAEAYISDTATNVTDQITSDFIQTQLTDAISTSFDANSFKLNTITVGEDNHELANSDLTTATTLNAKINYQYGGKEKISGSTNLTITTKVVDDTIISNTIANTSYEVSADLGSKATNVTEKINSNFIKIALSKKSNAIANAFNNDSFKLNTITVGEDNHELANSDLGKLRVLDAKINYVYNSKENSSDLKITINLSLPVNIASLVTDDNKNFTLEGVTTASSDTEIKNAILKQVLAITKDVLGDDMWNIIGSAIEPILGQYTIITLDNNSPHQGATVAASDGASDYVIGSADVTFTLATA